MLCHLLSLAAMMVVPFSSATTTVTVRNDQPRLDVDGQYVDAHDGMILSHTFPNGTNFYFLYGEFYNKTTGGPYPASWGNSPQMAVYTSPDLTTWSYRGPGVPSVNQSKWIPNVFFDKRSQRFVMWYGCGQWCVGVSTDGLTFTNVTVQTSRYGYADSTDGTGVFVDDDDQRYIIFSSPNHNHVVSIEKLTPDYLSSTKEVVAVFPDTMVESPSLFKRNGIYYATYGSCCCACRDGSGQVVLWSLNITGPWKKQYPYADINCADPSAEICGDFHGSVDLLVWNAQWWGPSFIPLASGETAIMFTGRRWLSGPQNPPACKTLCTNGPECNKADYFLARDFDVWYRLNFTEDGHVRLMEHLDSFQMEVP